MKLDLTLEQREQLEIAADLIANLIEEKIEARGVLLDQARTATGSYLTYLNELILDINADMRQLAQCRGQILELI